MAKERVLTTEQLIMKGVVSEFLRTVETQTNCKVFSDEEYVDHFVMNLKTVEVVSINEMAFIIQGSGERLLRISVKNNSLSSKEKGSASVVVATEGKVGNATSMKEPGHERSSGKVFISELGDITLNDLAMNFKGKTKDNSINTAVYYPDGFRFVTFSDDGLQWRSNF